MGVGPADAREVRVVERRPVVFCDFDGTIAIDEVIVEVWREFAPPGWERDVEDMLAGRKSLLQGDAEIFARIPTTLAPEIADFAKRTVRFRPGFEDLLRYCAEAAIEFNVITGALDFFVEPILAPYGERIARVVSIPADLTGEVIRFHADLACETCALCKAKVIDDYRDVFRIVIGDSITDEHGALIADAVFARDRLAAIMREHGLPHHEFDTLRDVRDTLRDCYRFPAQETLTQPPPMVGKRVERGGLPSPPLGEIERGPGAERGAPTSTEPPTSVTQKVSAGRRAAMTTLDAAGAITAIDGLIAAARAFHERGWMLGTSGNLSARLDSGPVDAGGPVIAITGSGASKGALSYADIAVLPEESRALLPALGAARRGPSAESAIHRMVYERLPEVGAVFHVHTVASTALSRAAAGSGGAPSSVAVEGLEMLKGLGVSWQGGALRAEIPVLANRADMGALAEEVGALLDGGAPLPALLVSGHGLTVWGATIEQARNRLEAAEFICEVLWSERAGAARPSGLPLEGG